ncbi:Programmed cell death protein 4 [Phytophthora boehmeriae]|uniref:Programmed cell death protein 4 n=1 Tax=Phytophthora boehmeriae TaxID=109152 RepID=A0A8T1W6K8_9STRA|nr:Programmed cell death protein 4 [Phytophthora boehmeriae]
MASDLWESELLRARQWLAAGRKDAHQEQQQIFERVKSHIQFRDHQRSLQSATTASEDEGDDLALDFLGDVDASDMNALLQAEAAKASVAPPPVEMATPSLMPSASDLLKPLEMPANLVSPKLKPTGKATVPMSQLKPKNIATGRDVGASATLGNDADVQKLMSDLQLDVTQLQQSDNEREEGKTEESTPPHLLKTYGAITKGTSNGSAQDKLRRLASHGIGSGRAAPSSYMHQATSKSPTEPHRKLAAASATSKSDDVAAEMLSWVSGYRDPAVIRRKEEMARRKRKTTRRYGVNSEEERRQALRELKQVTHRSSSSGSDSDSDGDFSSDYSPAEDVPEQEEPEEVDLLSDDYLNSDEDKQPKRRKRLRQTHVKQKKKKTRSRKPTITRKLSQPDASSMNQTEHEQGRETQSAQERQHVRKPVAIAGSSSQKSVDMSSKVTETIDLLSSGDDEADDAKDAGSSRIVEPFQKKNTESGSIDSTRLAHSKVTKMKKLSAFPPSAPTSAPTQIADNKGNDDKVTGDSTPLVATGKSVGDEQSLQGGGDDDFSDTGTVDLEGEELSLESDEKNREEKSDVTEVITGNSTNEEQVDEISNANSEPTNNGAHTEDQFADRNTGRSEESDSSIHATEVIKMSSAGKTSSDRGTDVLESSKMPSAGIKRSEPTNLGSNPDAPPHSREENNYDVSEAETEILDDDDVASDDLGLDYSDDSDPEKRAATDENTTDQKAAHKQQGNDELKQKDEGGMDVTKAGVQQFFEYGPLTLKPKAKTTTRKKIPIHNYAETHLSKSDSSAGKTTEEPKKTPVQATQPSIGSNGLRPSKKTIATTTSMKGKYAVTRRSTKLLSPDETPGGNRQRKSQYTMVLTRTRAETQDGEMSLLAKELSKESGRTSDARYLSYDGAKKTEDAPRYPAEAPRIVPKSRYGGGSQSTTPTAVQNSSVVSNGEHMQNDVLRDQATVPTWSAKKQKITHDTEETPTPGALAAFDDNDVDVFISDSDDDGGMANKEAEDIRFNLDRVPVDEVLMSKQVYVTGVNPTVCSEQLEEDFARFGVAVDRDVGFPAIDIFPCQRNHLGRGDACITFDTEDGAQAAVEELNSKNIKNSMIRVRRMDAHTQRILTLQFKTVRDTWKCTGTQCRADVSIWNAKCDKCGRKRVYGPSNIKIGAESWLCSLCYTANDSFATSCHGCMEALPEVDRSSFYTS